MGGERDLDASALPEHRLAIAAAHLGWGPVRVSAFRAGLAATEPDRERLYRHDPDADHDEAGLPVALVDSLGYRDGAAAREAAAMPPSDLPGADALLLMEAASHYAENGDGDFEPDEADWSCEATSPLDPFLAVMSREEWVAWFLDEHRAAVEAGRPGYADLILQDIRDPVIYVAYPDGRVDVWDGWHRIGAAMLKGAGTLPALVGVPPAPAPTP